MRPVLRDIFDIVRPDRYLEIGYGDGINFESVPLSFEQKTCVSKSAPLRSTGRMIHGASDDVLPFVGSHEYDLAFVDGDHEYKQVMRDICGAGKCLSRRGMIVVHDVNPLDKGDAVSTPEKQSYGSAWCGDAWKCVLHCMSMAAFGRVMTVESFPGWLCIWNVRRHMLLLSDVAESLPEYQNLTIQWARRNRKHFQFTDLETVLKAYRNDLRTHGDQ